VIRAAQDRCLTDKQGGAIMSKLFEQAQAQAALGDFALELRARPGQPTRTAKLRINAIEIWLRAPQHPRKGPGYLPPVRCWVVWVWEPYPPTGVAGLEWILLSHRQVETFAQALEIALTYATRWVIEEFHKALKSGTKAEALQLESAASLFATIALKSIVALRLLDLRAAAACARSIRRTMRVE
jgi:hypothetical protein